MLVDEPPDPVWPNMSRKDFLRFAASIRWMADQMGLRDWRLQLKWEPANTNDESDCYARIEVLGDIRCANIWLHEDFASMPEREQRRAICHELIHIHLDPITEVGDESLKDYLGLVGYEMLEHELHRTIERATESMAMHWGPLLDPIPESLMAEDDIAIRLRDGREMEIGEYLDLPKESSDAS